MDIHIAEGNWQFVRKDGHSHQLPYGMSFIGREECDITLQSRSADKRHAVIFHDSADKEVRIKDLNSVTGTYVNSVRIPEQCYVKLKHLDCVRLGYGPDVFYIQKITHTPSPVSPKKELPNSSVICNESETTITEINAKCTTGLVQTPTDQDNSAANESSLSLHEADSLEDIRQPLSRYSPSTSTPVFCEKGIPIGQSLPNMFGKGALPIDKEDGLVISEASRIQASKRADSIGMTCGLLKSRFTCNYCFIPIFILSLSTAEESAKDNSPQTEEVKDVQNLQTKDTSSRMQTEQLFNHRNLEEKPVECNSENEKVDTSESSPVAMAFTIAFDNDIPMPRKKLAIKDSISKYAPRKCEPDRVPPQKTRLTKTNEANLKKIPTQDVKDVNPSKVETLRKWISEDVKQNQHSVITRPPETTIWDLASKMEHKDRSSPEGKLSDAATFLIQKMLNGEPKPFTSQVTETIEPSSPRMTTWSHSWNNNKNQMDGITKSFSKTTIADQRLKSPENGPHVQKEIDDKSETGTYTVDTDQNDPAVEEARQKIDEIFGVQKATADKTGDHTGSNFSRNDKGREKQVLSLNEQNKLVSKHGSGSIKQQGSDGSSSEGNSPRLKTDRNPQRPKRRLPTPPIPKQLDASISDGHVSSDSRVSARLEHFPLSLAKKDKGQRMAHSSNQEISQQHRSRQHSAPVTTSTPTTIHITADNICDRKARFAENIRSQKVPPVGNKPGLVSLSITANTSHRSVDSNDSQAWSHTAQHDSCQNGDDDSLDGTTLSQYTPSDTRSEGSPQAKTPQSSGLWRRIPWNLSSSDLELNRSKSETASVVSDLSTSTEPSSLSSQYSKGKSDSAPPMRLNRAFALRRARLGIESDSAATISKAGSKENIRQQSATSGKTTNLNPAQLSRQDGGRFSLRLPRKAVPKPDDKTGTKSSASKKGRTALNKGGHRRIDSDPGKTNLHWRQIDIINDTINSDIEVSQIPVISSSLNNPPTFHRSASFDGAEELLCAKDNVDSSVQKRAGRPTQLLKTSGISKLRKCGGIETARALGISPGWQHSSMEEKESEKIVPQPKGSPQQSSSFTKRELSALDSLVISAIHQLSIKLRTGARCLLEKERQNHAESSDRRLMIEEVLPQIVEKKSSTHNEGNLTRDLSSILKNLKRVEQSLEVLSSLADYDNEAKSEPSQVETKKFFVVNV